MKIFSLPVHLFFTILVCLFIHTAQAQNIGINSDGSPPHTSAMLDVKSTTKGMLIPRMTGAQRAAIASPAQGLNVFDTDTKTFWYYNGTAWGELTGGTSNWTTGGNNIYNNNTGNVGIGLTNPSTKLEVQTADANYGILHSNGTVSVGTYLGSNGGWIATKSFSPLYFCTGLLNGNNVAQMALLTNGNVGIGTGSPTTKLAVVTNDASYGVSQTNGIVSVSTYVGSNAGWIGTQTNHPLHFYTNSGNALMTVATNGYVGIGNTSPSDKLMVQTASNSYGITHTDGTITLSTFVGGSGAGGYIGTKSNHPLYFYTHGGSPLMTVATSGNVGIGATSPAAKLHIVGDNEALRITGNGSFMSFYNGASYKGYLWNKGANDMELSTSPSNSSGKLYLSINGTPSLTILNDRRVGINGDPGISNVYEYPPDFTVNGSLVIKNNYNLAQDEWGLETQVIPYSGGNRGYLDFYKNGVFEAGIDGEDGSWFTSSDIRLKDGIESYKPVLDGVKKINVATFHYKANPKGTRSFGLIAQNVAGYFPEIVSERINNKGEKLMGIAYAKTGVIAIKAIQEQQKIIEDQQKQINDLKKELDEIKGLLKK